MRAVSWGGAGGAGARWNEGGSYGEFGHEGCVGGWGDELQDAEVGGGADDLCGGLPGEVEKEGGGEERSIHGADGDVGDSLAGALYLWDFKGMDASNTQRALEEMASPGIPGSFYISSPTSKAEIPTVRACFIQPDGFNSLSCLNRNATLKPQAAAKHKRTA